MFNCILFAEVVTVSTIAAAALAGGLVAYGSEVIYQTLTARKHFNVHPDTWAELNAKFAGTVDPGDTLEVVDKPAAGIDKAIVVKDNLGNGKFALGIAPKGTFSDDSANAAAENANTMIKTPEGRSLLKTIPAKMKASDNAGQNEADFDTASPVAQRAAAKVADLNDVNVPVELKAKHRAFAHKQDSARVSKEWHEWNYCIVKSDDWDLLTTVPTNKGITYTGVEPVTTPALANGPPYFQWVRDPVAFPIIKLLACVRRFKRARSACGGKALWTEQGFATKRDAIEDDIANDVTCQGYISTLVADPSYAAN